MTSKCSNSHCNHPAPLPSREVPAPFCKWCTQNPGSGRQKPADHWSAWELTREKADKLFGPTNVFDAS